MVYDNPKNYSPECISTISELCSLCRDEDVIVYGTGKIGKLMVPYLQRNTSLKIRGVTNSHVSEKDEDTFLDTGLPVDDVRAWYEKFPKATVLITVVRQDFQTEILYICREVGFKRILAVSSSIEYELIQDRAKTLFSAENRAFFELMATFFNSYLVDKICIANEIQDVHKASFAEFRGRHKNQSIAVVGSGPSLNYYTQMEGISHIGVNTTFLKPGIKLDYLFTQDYREENPNAWLSDLKKYSFVKFFGTAEWTDETRWVYQIPENIIEENQGRKFTLQANKEFMHCDIEHYPLVGLGSIIFCAFQFALHTGARRIYLVGCDCSATGHYDGSGGVTVFAGKLFVDGWSWMKKFVNRFYPGVEILSVNPVGLKGLFHDVYTEAYLKEHPEIDRSTCEVLDLKDGK